MKSCSTTNPVFFACKMNLKKYVFDKGPTNHNFYDLIYTCCSFLVIWIFLGKNGTRRDLTRYFFLLNRLCLSNKIYKTHASLRVPSIKLFILATKPAKIISEIHQHKFFLVTKFCAQNFITCTEITWCVKFWLLPLDDLCADETLLGIQIRRRLIDQIDISRFA